MKGEAKTEMEAVKTKVEGGGSEEGKRREETGLEDEEVEEKME